MNDVLKINSRLADDLRSEAEDITEVRSEVLLFQGETEVDGFYSVGYVDYGQASDHLDTHLIVIRERNQYYASSYYVGRDDTPNCWADLSYDADDEFVAFTPVEINYVTRIDWVRGS